MFEPYLDALKQMITLNDSLTSHGLLEETKGQHMNGTGYQKAWPM